jgi:hypothetical protein
MSQAISIESIGIASCGVSLCYVRESGVRGELFLSTRTLSQLRSDAVELCTAWYLSARYARHPP